MLRGVPFPGLHDYTLPPSLFLHLVKGRFNMFIGVGAAQPDAMIAFLAAKLLSKPFILWNVQWFYNTSTMSKVRYPIWRHIVLNSDALILPGEKSRDFHLALGVNENRVFLSPNTSELETSEQGAKSVAKLRKSLGYTEENRVVLCFTRISPEKGLEYLVESYRHIGDDNVKILIATTLPPDRQYFGELSELTEAVSKENISLKVFRQDQKADLFRLCDVFVLPSIWRENVGPDVWGMVLNEALSVGKPLIATTSTGGAYDVIVPGKNGYIVRDRDPRQLGLAIRKVVNSNRLEAMGEYSRALHNRRFRLEDEVDGFEGAFNYAGEKKQDT